LEFLTAITFGVDTVKVGWSGRRPKALKALIKLGGWPYRGQYGRMSVYVHNLTKAKLAEVDHIAITDSLNTQRVDFRWDFSFAAFNPMWKWLRFAPLWIPHSRNATRLEFADYCYNGEPVFNGNWALHDYRKESNRKGRKAPRNLMRYRGPHMLTGLPYPTPTVREELRIEGKQAVERFVPSLSSILNSNLEGTLRQHICLRIDGACCELPPLPVPIEWEVDR
jgi:hypothetical protein